MRPSRRLPPPAIDYATRIVILSEYATADESKDLSHDATKRRPMPNEECRSDGVLWIVFVVARLQTRSFCSLGKLLARTSALPHMARISNPLVHGPGLCSWLMILGT